MKWAKYSGLLLLSFCLFFGLSPLKQVKADSLPVTDGGFYVVPYNNKYIMTVLYYNLQQIISEDAFMFGSIYRSYTHNTLEEAINDGNWFMNNIPYGQYFDMTQINMPSERVYNFNIPTFNPDPVEESWWDKVKEAFMDFVGSEALSDVLSGEWLSYIDDVLFGELWTVKVGEGEDDMIIPETVSATPTPSPTPIPSPIPYSTVIDPDTGEIHYHYTIDVSGTPIPTSSIYPPVTSTPPGPGSGSTIDEPVAVEDYYEPEDSLSVPKLRIFKFLLRMTGNDVDVGMDSLNDNMAVMDATLEDNAEAISGVGDLLQLIPVKWFILIGTLACFPVIAAMIKSLLGG